MGNARKPGPVCSTRVGDQWIDAGTLCRTKTPPPLPAGYFPETAAKFAFDRDHAYSLAPEARRKRAIDLEIIGGDYTRSSDIRIDSEDYLKKLIAIASGNAVSGKAKRMQFYVVRGGAEGMLPDDLRGINANSNETSWTGTDGKPGRTIFDENDLIAVFAPDGTLIGSARLRRPTLVSASAGVRGNTANRVLAAWDGKNVFVYPSHVEGWIPYLGLAVDDGFRDGSANQGRHVYIDLHKQEQTNGCIFIVDPATPAVGTDELRTFEPALIKKIIAAKGLDPAKLKGRVNLGTMKVVAISA
ncbi:MAG TPA: hypothetical protein VNU96_05565 [Burkholderiales bacterium]|jgi:hypothetical protein|nr:hypothetical protein [Burkholderiales bacterium]